MPFDEKTLRQDLKKGLRPVYLLYGEESYVCAQYAARIAALAVPEDVGGFNLQVLDGKTTSAEQIAEAIEALPLMAERKCVTVRDLEITAAGVAERVIPLLQDPPSTTVTVLSYLHIQPQPKKQKKWKALLDTVQTTGAVVFFAKKKPADLIPVLCSGADRRGCTLSPRNAELLVQQCGTDMGQLSHELDKLAALADGKEITAELITAAATRNLEARVYDLTNAILRHQSDRAFVLLQTLLQQKEDPVSILAVLTNAYVDMYRAKTAQPHGGAAAIISAFPAYRDKDFRLRYAARDAATLSMPDLYRTLDILAAADTALKSSRTPPRLVLEQTIAQLL